MNSSKKGIVTKEELVEIIANRTYEERFELLMKLIRINRMLQTAKIIEAEKENI